RGMAIDGLGDVVLVGHFHGASIDFGNGPIKDVAVAPDAMFLAKLAGLSGAAAWSRSFGDATSTDTRAWTVATGPSNHIVAAALLCQGHVDFGGGPISGDSVVVKFGP